MPTHHPSRRHFLTLLGATPFAVAGLSACGTSGPGGGGSSGGDASLWYLSGDPNETIKNETLKTWNGKHPDAKVAATFFQNDAYKTKIKTAIGAGKAPTLIYGWGGGTLRSYAEAGQVLDLTSWFEENPELREGILPATFEAATVDDKIYAMPNENAAPLVFYYNKELFEKAGAEPPESWDDLMALVPVFTKQGVAPISLGGQSRWTSMMWLECLLDRIGGPEVFSAIYDGQPDAWSDPAVIKTLSMTQDLVGEGGFVKGFRSITADSNADLALLYTGKAAMMLHGSWTYAAMKGEGGDFVPGGKLGWTTFPGVDGGQGDPGDAIGNPAQYMSISAKASAAEQKAAKQYLAEGIMNGAVIDRYIETGQVCVAADAEARIAKSDDKDFLGFAYGLTKDAPSFQQSWDQALSPSTAEVLLNNIDQLFGRSITPQKFAQNLNATLGQ